MKKYYLSHVDFTEIANVTSDSVQLDKANKQLTELGLLTEKGNPSVSAITQLAHSTSKAFFEKLRFRLRYRFGAEGVTDTLKMLCDQKNYYGAYLYIALMYGFLGWQVPDRVALLPAAPDALKCYCTELIRLFKEYANTEHKEDDEESPQDELTDL